MELRELEPIGDGARLSVHHGTSRIPARVVRVGETHAQLRLAAPVVAARGDHVVLRRETTVGGAVVLDPAPPRRTDAERDRLLGESDPASIVRGLVHEPVSVEQLAARALLGGAQLEEGLDAVRVVDGWAFSDAWLEQTAVDVEARLRARAEASPLDPGLVLAELLPPEPWAAAVLDLLPVERRGPKVVLPGTAASLGARRGRGRSAGARPRERGPGCDEGRRTASSPATSRAKACSSGSATASPSAPAPTRSPATSS